MKIKSFSIIISAYKSKYFIEECLDSIINQTYFINNDNFEILIGIDDCQETLDKLSQINHKYKNLRIFMMDNNNGPYITLNTLFDLTKYDNILRFDSDDIMKPELISEVSNFVEDYDIIKFHFIDFKENINNITKKSAECAFGVIFYKKNIIELAGGYQPWKCAADREFLYRIYKKAKIIEIKKHLFYRRVHENSLTNNINTGMSSKLRKEYKRFIKFYDINENIKINKVISQYKEINF